MTKWLKCAECTEMFEVSNEIADAMHRWRDESGEPFTCGDCAGVAEIHENSKRRRKTRAAGSPLTEKGTG